MHIPDGFVDIPTAAATGAVSLGTIAYALRKTGKDLGERTVPLLGVTAAFIFAAQMLNFPVAGGTSGHFLGAALAAALLGPWGAAIVMTVVLVVQALVMADGGITALGANALNMAVIGVLIASGVFHLVKKILPRSLPGYLAAVAVASWVSVVGASMVASVELALSDTVPFGVALPAMASVHMIIGLGEALITTAIIAAVYASRPDLIRGLRPTLRPTAQPAAAPATGPRRPMPRMRLVSFIVAALVVAAALAVFVSPFASSSPDGLERVAADQGFESAAAESPVWDLSPLPDYRLPGIGDARISTAVAGLIGTVLLFAVVVGLGWALGRYGPRPGSRSDPV